jgi:hypothetical protein
LVHGPADYGLTCTLANWEGLARDHGLIDSAAALQDLTIDGHPLAGPDSEAIANGN